MVYGGARHHDGPFNQYLDWLKQNTRLKLKVAMDEAYIEDLPSDPEDVFPEYGEITRSGRQPERGPFEDYIVSYHALVINFICICYYDVILFFFLIAYRANNSQDLLMRLNKHWRSR